MTNDSLRGRDVDKFLASAHKRLLRDQARSDHVLVKAIGEVIDRAPFEANRETLLQQGRIEALNVQEVAGRKVIVHAFLDLPEEFRPPPPEAA